MANETWALVKKVESQHPGHNMYIYAPLGRIRTDVGQKFLKKVISSELKLSAFSKELKNSPAEKGEETALQMLRGTKVNTS
ncbi:hypothetical protein FSP39_006192 [Pinctada imbricata]|uniref:Uncharacterized protein n=1 Tax=Pinctada imbricata TaxID=66713 RepID=A0AA89CDT5_PINIB|nr:hypothetical protein FSP39_006192 [Pinctada imbricata]